MPETQMTAAKIPVVSKPVHKWWTLTIVCFALLMIVLDNTVVNLAIPKILQHFGATIAQLEWVNNGYLLTFAVFLITFGRLGDEVGRKKMFMIGLVVFAVGSLLCGLSQNVGQLIAFRVMQGLGGAAMMPATLSIIASTFAAKERGAAMGVWGGVAGLGIAIGPILGGYITDLGLGQAINSLLHVSQYWRFVFFINVPIGILAFVGAWLVIRESRDRQTKHHFDIPGIILSALAIFTLTFALIEGEKYGWWHATQPFTVFGQAIHLGSIGAIPIFFTLAVVFAGWFLLRERHISVDPLVDMQLFKSRNFSAGNLTIVILAFGMMGSFFLLPLFLQSILGFSAIKTGTVLLPMAIMLMISAPLAGRLSDRLGGKWLIFGGMFVMAAGTYWLGNFTLDISERQLLWPFLVLGLAMGVVQAPLTNITLYDIPPDEAGGASGVFTTARQVGSVMGIAILGAVLQAALSTHIVTEVQAIKNLPATAKAAVIAVAQDQTTLTAGQGQTAIAQALQSSLPATSTLTPAEQNSVMQRTQQLGQKIGIALRQAFTDSINFTIKIATIFALIGALSSLFFINHRSRHEAGPPGAV